MRLVFKTRYFSAADKARGLVGTLTGSVGGTAGGALGLGAGYIGGRIAGKMIHGSKEEFVENYLAKHPMATREEAARVYKEKRGSAKKWGTLIGGVGGAIGGYKYVKGSTVKGLGGGKKK